VERKKRSLVIHPPHLDTSTTLTLKRAFDSYHKETTAYDVRRKASTVFPLNMLLGRRMMITATRTLLCCLIIIIACSSQYHSASSFIPPPSSSSSLSQRRRQPLHYICRHHDTRSSNIYVSSSSCDTTAAGPSSSESLSSSSSSSSSSRSQYWINDEILKADEIIQLLGIVEDSSTCTITEEQQQRQQQPTATTIHRNKSGNAIAVEVTSAITMNNVKNIRALSNGIQEGISSSSSSLDKKKLRQHFKHRGFGEGQGGNDCTYLAPFLQVFCPNVVTSLKDIATLAWKAASWDVLDDNDEHPDPMSLGIRTSEHLSYKGWPSLEAHKDIGSIYTIMISIKDPKEYDGGEFFIHNSMIESTNVKLDMLSAIVFKSNTIHGVRPIISGHRESFVTELWSNNDSPIGLCRPTEEQWDSFSLDTTTAN
jgi:hypothetical protein